MNVSPRLSRWIRSNYGPAADPVLLELVELPSSFAGGQDDERIATALVLNGASQFAASVELARVDWRDLLVGAHLASSEWTDRLDAILGPK